MALHMGGTVIWTWNLCFFCFFFNDLSLTVQNRKSVTNAQIFYFN